MQYSIGLKILLGLDILICHDNYVAMPMTCSFPVESIELYRAGKVYHTYYALAYNFRSREYAPEGYMYNSPGRELYVGNVSHFVDLKCNPLQKSARKE